jgi:RAT1-interacting protein
LNYYYPPLLGADLSAGFDTFQKRDESIDEHLDGLLKALKGLEEQKGEKCTADIITWRGMMTKVIFCYSQG